MAKKIKGNNDGMNGRNDSYFIPGRGHVTRRKAVAETKAGKHPCHSIYIRDGEEYLRSKRDSKRSNNLNK